MVVSSRISDLIEVYHEQKLAHAFLLETNDLEQCYKDVLELIKIINCPFEYSDKCEKECNLCNLIDCNNLPSLITVSPIGQYIKKEQILEIMEKFKTKPIYSKYNNYIVKEADKLNASSANTFLKFLEEPEDGIIGFFITNNASNVISTIRSRCQIVNCIYELDNALLDDEILDYVKLYLNSIYKNTDDLLYNKVEVLPLFKERKDWEIFFLHMFYYFREIFEKKRKDIISSLENYNDQQFIEILLVIEGIIKLVRSNVNIDLVLDKFVIEMRKFYEG